MSDNTLSIRIIFGSARNPRFCDVIGKWLLARLEPMPGVELAVLDPRELDLPQGHTPGGASVRQLRESLAGADAFIIVTPEYNRSYPGALKILIDSAYDEWGAKPVAFVSYGGISGGLRAAEQLRSVFAELHAVTVRDVVSFANPWDSVDAAGQFEPGPPAVNALETMMNKLGWWAHALKRARFATPYREA
ncbi:NADPH-dependent oxidoreductase [Agrobacterium tumefaciens]|uniref:NADPH-dependent oxidoreductase n=1 Tax=Agrobacterium tumefaciens TaxID=358 RepID=A0A546Y050_AGRTU|nr:NAD(P)H-dependent oxidoreductase [Agrobacterium tumefaciens]TRB06358.1 NADPH-dependent oxidoreductase [Agrobacterium tumefaciens]